jgi:branched-subunit amino acid aminotransferase/4-amino-4-deoxychorismate lyase
MASMRIEIDGRAPTAEELAAATSAFGHFTAMQVRGGRVRGLELHLDRLEGANRELFDADLDRDRIVVLLRNALSEVEDASLRVYFYEAEAAPKTVVTVRQPGGVTSPQRLQSVRYQRPSAHLKHLATEQGFHARVARLNGFDDAVLAGTDGTISETTIANIGFFDELGVVWPDAPLLRGITMQLLESRAPSRTARIRLQDIESFEGAFLSNARGVAAVNEIDGITLSMPEDRLEALEAVYASVPWDEI